MQTRFIPRLLALSLLLTLALATTFQFHAAASDRTEWNDTQSVEDGLVQTCDGFNVTGSYTSDRAHQLVENYFNNQVFERQIVSFAGTLGEATTGKSYAYDGGFTRTAQLREGGEVNISNLSLRFEVGTPGQFTYTLKQVDFELSDNPQLIVKTIVQNVLQMDICRLFGGSSAGYGPLVPSFDERWGKNSAADLSTENSAFVPGWSSEYTEHPSAQNNAESARSQTREEDAAANDDMTPWTELDPCDSSPPGKAC